LAGLVVQLISRLMWLFFGWLKLILMSQPAAPWSKPIQTLQTLNFGGNT
jgi:uncharacterized protein with PQ loop repeat